MAKKTYRVAGAHTVLGHAPGHTFECELDPKTEARLVTSGALQAVIKATAAPTNRALEPAPKKDKE